MISIPTELSAISTAFARSLRAAWEALSLASRTRLMAGLTPADLKLWLGDRQFSARDTLASLSGSLISTVYVDPMSTPKACS